MAGQKVIIYHWARVVIYNSGLCPHSTVFYVHNSVEWIENWKINISIESYEGTVNSIIYCLFYRSVESHNNVGCLSNGQTIFILTCNNKYHRSLSAALK